MNHLCVDCNRVATHANPQLCDRCMARKHSTQYFNGKSMPYPEFYKMTMPEGMGKQEDETRDEWFARCQEYIQGGGYAGRIGKGKGKKRATESSEVDT